MKSSYTHIPLLAGATLMLLVALGGYTFLFMKINAAANEAQLLAAAAGQASAQDDRSRAAQSLLAAVGTDSQATAQYIIPKEGVADFIASIEALHAKTGALITVSSVALVPASGFSWHELVQLTFTAHGSFAQLSKVVALLETFPVPLSIEQSYVERDTSDTAHGTIWAGSFTIMAAKEKSL